MNRLEAAGLIERFIKGDDEEYEWDDFICCPHKDELIESVRVKCSKVRDVYPPDEPRKYCSKEGENVLLNLAQELRLNRDRLN